MMPDGATCSGGTPLLSTTKTKRLAVIGLLAACGLRLDPGNNRVEKRGTRRQAEGLQGAATSGDHGSLLIV